MVKADYGHFKDTASKQIEKYGMDAVLRRSGVDRDCKIVVTQFSPFERHQLANPTDRKVLLSAKDLTIDPDNELDVLVTYVQPVVGTPVVHEILKIVAPPGRVEMAGVTVFWRLQVRR